MGLKFLLTNITVQPIVVYIAEPEYGISDNGKKYQKVPASTIVPAGLFYPVSTRFEDVKDFIKWNQSILERGLIRLSDEDTKREDGKLHKFAWEYQHEKNVKTKQALDGATDVDNTLGVIKDKGAVEGANVEVNVNAFGESTKSKSK